MSLNDELETYVKGVLAESWQTRAGQVVPDPQDLPLRNLAVTLEATVLYADLASSTDMVATYTREFAAEVYKTYLYCAAKIIRANNGSITAYDGDRVMGVFIGDAKNSNAAKCALKINGAVHKIIQPAIKAQYSTTSYELEHKVGVDTSSLFIARTGIRGSNDLVWVGNAANNAAKMAALPATYQSYISSDVYSVLNAASRYGADGETNMWTSLGSSALGYPIYGSSWHWTP
ncbi:adenylate/guanylate cyclase domain-containing protein [Terrabacter sp. C0L_2]|uniref:adenylate/guanylate cyclase domain-containing protein n=1 Tax=Terrabacter sp. C0L_2 TaxID=3108389 RepID=UPI002ECFEA16|nr:adenylate/guanylate cyclase domain-containing protein [Terrabacter sp. C0L_2]